MMTLYYSVIDSASFNPNNLHNPPFMFNGFAASVARSADSRPNTKPPNYSDLFDPNPPSYEKALEFEKNEQLAAIQINSNINDTRNNVENTFAQLKPREKCFLLFKSIGLVLLTISMITMMVFIISKYA
jgi:hypothetical protein